jgi:hypothetical protein
VMRPHPFVRLADWVWPVLIVCSAVAVVVLAALDVVSPARTAVSVWFLAVCPGMAWARVVGFRDPATRWTVAIGASLSVELLLALAMVYGRRWSIPAALGLLAAVSVAGAMIDVLVSTPRRAQAEGDSA